MGRNLEHKDLNFKVRFDGNKHDDIDVSEWRVGRTGTDE